MLIRNAWKIAAAIVLVCPFAGSCVMAQLINRDFSLPLGPPADGLEWDYDVVGIVGGVAVLGEDPFYTAYLEQVFTIPDLALSLSFDYRPLFEPFYGEESFSVSLLDPGTFLPLVPTDADPLDTSETYYFMHDWDDFLGVDDVITDPAYVTLTDLGGGWTDVTLDLTSLGGTATGALLAFDLIPGFFDYGLESQIEVDNVSVAVVPEPTTLLLLGFGCMALSRKRR